MKSLRPYLFAGAIALGAAALMSNSGGLAAGSQDQGATGAPGESVCMNCHSGANYGTVLPNILVLDPITSNPVTEYVPGTVYRLRIEVMHTMGTPAGFGSQTVALFDADDSDVNAFSNPSSNAQIAQGGNPSNRFYLEQNGLSGSNIFEADFTAPASGSGAITFYSVAVAASGGAGTGGGDTGGNTSITLTEEVVSTNSAFELDAIVSAFPNPVREQLNVAINTEMSGDYQIQLSDMSGKLVLSDMQTLGSGETIFPLDVATLASGQYTLTVRQGQTFKTLMINKQ